MKHYPMHGTYTDLKVTIIQEGGYWNIWLSINPDDCDPRDVSESFVIGCGKSRESALNNAAEVLRNCASNVDGIER